MGDILARQVELRHGDGRELCGVLDLHLPCRREIQGALQTAAQNVPGGDACPAQRLDALRRLSGGVFRVRARL